MAKLILQTFGCLILCLTGFLCFTLKPKNKIETQFNEFKKQFHRNYSTPEEEATRKAIFTKNLALITSHNLLADKGIYRFHLAINNFTDLTNEEYQRMALFALVPEHYQNGMIINYVDPPASRDWSKEGVVSPVPSDARFEYSGAYATAGAIESEFAILKKQKLVELSVEQLVDCCTTGNGPCSAQEAFRYILQQGGLDTKSGYFRNDTANCNFNPKTIGAKLKNYGVVWHGREEDLEGRIGHNGPAAVFIDASLATFQFYSHGVYDDVFCNFELGTGNHNLLAVGYGTDGKEDNRTAFFKAKNWWGTQWGEEGYVRIVRGQNFCGIANNITFPFHVIV